MIYDLRFVFGKHLFNSRIIMYIILRNIGQQTTVFTQNSFRII